MNRHFANSGLIGLALGLSALTGSPAVAQDTHSANHAPMVPAAESTKDAHRHDDLLSPRSPQLLPGYGNGGFAITGANPQAAAFFANGLELHAAFAHRAGVAAMEQAVRLDPACGMCQWGLALVDGPTINYGKKPDDRAKLLVGARAARRAVAATGTPKERALTDALVLRYQPGKDTAKLDRAYSAAMQTVAARFPADNEIAVLTADALMVASFAEEGGYNHRLMDQAVVLLEQVLARAPQHTPAIHFYIHATEVIGKPGLAEAYADRLADLAPRASHLVHMPSHTYYWVGRYQDAAETNHRAVQIGKDNAKALGLPAPKGVWDLPYHAHNVIFGLGGALMAGDSRIGLDLARPLVETASQRDKGEPWWELLAASGLFAMARFDPAATLQLPEPKLPYLKAAWHYARGESQVWAGDLAAARLEMEAIPTKIATGKPDKEAIAAEQMLGITRAVLTGRIAMAEQRWADAAAAFREGAVLEETESFSDFTDPPAFWYPVRRDLAAALLAAGDAAGAQREAQAALNLRKHDPIALRTLAAARARLALDSPQLR